MMQLRVNEDTLAVEGQRATRSRWRPICPPTSIQCLRDKILTVRDGQSEVKDAAQEKIHQQLVGPDEPSQESK